MIKKGKDLKVGDVLLKPYYSIVYEIDVTGDGPSSFFWSNRPNISLFDLNDSYFGPGCSGLDLEEEFEVEEDRKKIVKAYKTVENDINKHIADSLVQKNKLADIKLKILEGLNNVDN